eukprot:2207656-Amphidinium_carterae.1
MSCTIPQLFLRSARRRSGDSIPLRSRVGAQHVSWEQGRMQCVSLDNPVGSLFLGNLETVGLALVPHLCGGSNCLINCTFTSSRDATEPLLGPGTFRPLPWIVLPHWHF